jgi:predicted O-methyltransferase YrrM
LSGRRSVRQKNVFEVLPSKGVVTLALAGLDTGETWFWPQALYTQDIVSLCMLCRIIRPKVVFEIGTLDGYSAHHFALNTTEGARIFTLDLPRGEDAQPGLPTTAIDELHIRSRTESATYHFAGSAAAKKITALSGDSATFDFSPYHRAVDLFFIDGAHSYEYTRSDTRNALKCCRPGGVIAWHDYGKASLPGVSRYIDELAKQRAIYAIPGGSLAFMVVE